jgi:hypothetical protein
MMFNASVSRTNRQYRLPTPGFPLNRRWAGFRRAQDAHTMVTELERYTMVTSIVNSAGGDSSKFRNLTAQKDALSFGRVRPLLGPSWIINGEDPELYERLLTEAAKAIGPRDIIDWLLVKDVVAHTWEIQRGRRNRESLMRLRKRHVLQNMLVTVMPSDSELDGPFLAERWSQGVKTAVDMVKYFFEEAGLSMADLDAQVLSNHAAEFERIEAQTGRCEDRRDKLLLQIERRRSGSAQAVLKASENVIDAEFENLPPHGSAASAGETVGEQQATTRGEQS